MTTKAAIQSKVNARLELLKERPTPHSQKSLIALEHNSKVVLAQPDEWFAKYKEGHPSSIEISMFMAAKQLGDALAAKSVKL